MDSNELRVEEAPVGFELSTIQDLRVRLRRRGTAPDLGEGWERGTSNTWIAELVDDWR